MPVPLRPALLVATLALGGAFPVGGLMAHEPRAQCPEPPHPPAPPHSPEPLAPPQPPEPPLPPLIDISAMHHEAAQARREVVAAIRDARAEVEREPYMPKALRAKVLAELDSALARVERDRPIRVD